MEHTEGKYFICEICGKSFTIKSVLKNHLKCHSTERDFKCHICEKAFKFKPHLMTHFRIHENRNFMCNVCLQTFASETDFEVHFQTHAGKSSDRCPFCELSFRHLKIHMRIHEEDSRIPLKKDDSRSQIKLVQKYYICDLCQRSFSQIGHLRRHALTHTGERPFHCEICGKSFAGKSDLNYHLRTHSSEREFKCNMCEKAFKLKHTLTAHLRTHEDGNFICTICEKTFVSKQNFEVHFRKHSGDNPYQCSFCDRAFHRNDYLQRHIRSKHEKGNPSLSKSTNEKKVFEMKN